MSTAYCVEPTCENTQEHRHCSSCGLVLPGGGAAICAHHQFVGGDEWAVANRTFCDLIHRGIEPPPVVLPEKPPVEWEPAWA